MIASTFQPPIRLLLQSILPDGIRLPKLAMAKKSWSAPHRTIPIARDGFRHHPEFGMIPKKPGERLHEIVVGAKGNLHFSDYRFWQGSEFGVSMWTRCRACREVICGNTRDVEMKVHSDHYKCSIHLTVAYAYLLRGKLCVVCEKKSSASKWGIPLCSLSCQEKWMFEDPIYPLLFKAVAEANTPELQKRIQAAREVWEKENRETSK